MKSGTVGTLTIDLDAIAANWRLLAALVVIAALAGGSARAQQAQPDWIADARTGCKVNGKPQPNEIISWSGACADGLAQGSGTLQWFKAGKPIDKYVGEYLGGKRNGRGVYTWPSGGRYEGEYRDDERNGRGVYTSADGNRYDGEWRDGKQHGRGVYTWADGDRYDGEYRDGKPDGSGTFHSPKGGVTHSGQWTNGCFRQGDRWAAVDTTKEECGFK